MTVACQPFTSCLLSFPASGSFQMSWRFTSDSQSVGASVSASVLPMNIQGWFPLGLIGLISLKYQGLSRVFSITTVQKHKFYSAQPFFIVQLSHLYKITGKTKALTIRTFVGKVMPLLFNTPSRLVITFLPRSECLNFITVVTVHRDFGTQENKVCHCFPIYLPWSDRTRCHDLSFQNVEF